MTAPKNPKRLSALHASDYEYLLMNIPENLREQTPTECRFVLKMVRELMVKRLKDHEGGS